MTIEKRVVVITGASSGIGAALARQLAARGDAVVLAARREEALRAVAGACGAEALAVVADVTRRAEVQRILDEGVARFGRVDVWVNNAGRGISRPVAQLTDEDLDEMMTVNLKSALYGMQVALAHFQPRGSGHIINVSSMLGRIPFASVRAAYSAAKHALMSLTANLRVDVRTTHPGIHVSAFIPGVVATEFGLNAKHGGVDSRAIPGAQDVDETAAEIVALIDRPRAEHFSRPAYKQQVAAYYAADDLGELESKPPFVMPPRP